MHLTNLALAVLVAGACLLVGWRDFLLVQGPPALLAGAAGIWLFYVQHQFEDTYWERNTGWTYADAALRGSSYLRLPKVLQFFTGNIGLHHVHHLNSRIPNYNLQAAHDSNPVFAERADAVDLGRPAGDPAEALGRGLAPPRDLVAGAQRRRRADRRSRRGQAAGHLRPARPRHDVRLSAALRA